MELNRLLKTIGKIKISINDMKKVLVTGGAGFIGSHVVSSLTKSGFEVVVLDNLIMGDREVVENILNVPFIEGQVGDKKLLRTILDGSHPACGGKFVDAVMHFAAHTDVSESVMKPMKFYINNVGDSLHLMEAICLEDDKRKGNQKNRIPIIFSSSCATYGKPLKLPIEEDHPQFPINPYGRSKLIIEQIIKDLWITKKLPSVIFRYFNAAGADLSGRMGEKHNPETHLIPLALKAALDKKKSLNLYGIDYPTYDGTCIRDYIHVVDLADAHVRGLQKVLKKSGHHIYNLGTGIGYSVNQIIKKVEQITESSIKVRTSFRREGDPPVLVASSEKAYRELSWKPSYSDLETIIRSAYNWHKNE